MATNIKVFSVPLGNEYTMYVRAQEESQNASGNYTVVSATQYATRPSSSKPEYRWNNTGALNTNVKIEGATAGTANGLSYNFNNNATIYLASGRRNVTHNADGNKSTNIQGYMNDNYWWNTTGSWTYVLTRLQRFAEITSTSYTATSFTSVRIGVQTKLPVNMLQWRVAGGAWSSNIPVSGTSFNYEIRGLSAGFRGNIEISVRQASSGLWSNSTMYVAVNPLPITTVRFERGRWNDNPDFREYPLLDIDYNVILPTITTVRSKVSSRVLHQETNNSGGLRVNIDNTAQRNILAQDYPNTSTATYVISSTFQQTGYPDVTTTREINGDFDVLVGYPTIVIQGTRDSSGKQVEFGTEGYIQKLSNIQISFSTLTPTQGATNNYAQITFQGRTIRIASPSTGTWYNLGQIVDEKDTSIRVDFADSRQLLGSDGLRMTVVPYKTPTPVGLIVERQYGYETASYIRGQIQYTPIKGETIDENNNLTVAYSWREMPTGSWSGYTAVTRTSTTTSSGYNSANFNFFMRDFDNKKAYQIRIRLANSQEPTEYTFHTYDLPKGTGLVSFREDKVEVGVPLDAVGGFTTPSISATTITGGAVTSTGSVFQNTNIPVANGPIGTLPSGNCNLGSYWKNMRSGTYWSDSGTHLTNSKGSWSIVQVFRLTNEPGGNNTRVLWFVDGGTVVNGSVNSGDTMVWRTQLDTANVANHIVEQGSNYRKWSNGIMEQWELRTISPAIATNVAIGPLFRNASTYVLTFPQAFINNNVVVTPVSFGYATASMTAVSSTAANIQFVAPRNVDTVDRISYIAIGRWQ